MFSCDELDSFENNDGRELSLFDTDSKESGFCDDDSELLLELDETALDREIENSIVEFLPPNSPLSNSFNDNQFTREREFTTNAIDAFNRNAIRQFQNVENDDVNHVSIMNAVEKSNNDLSLIGDFSKACILPLLTQRAHPDLKTISACTMKDLLEGKYINVINSYKIIDCRYPYEYCGGHIEGSYNIYQREQCLDMLFQLPPKPENERHILIFHCEFSMERAPNMLRALREKDRILNALEYPKLMYPEIYVLGGGYKEFFHSYPNWCKPQAYMRMIHPNHTDDLRKFRKKSKSIDLSKTKEHESKLRRYYSDTDM